MTTPDPEHKITRRELLFTLWVFVMFLYAYCDILGLYDPEILRKLFEGSIDGIAFNETTLTAFGILMILPISMIPLTRIAPFKFARWANIFTGAFKTLVMIVTLMTPCTLYYWMFAIIEIATTLTIVWLAWTWREGALPLQNSDTKGM